MFDYGNFYLSENQNDDMWQMLRSKRVTASNFSVAAGHGGYITSDQLEKEIVHGQKREIDETTRKFMDHGKEKEGEARKWYENTFKIKVLQVGIAIPKWNTWIGASPDGLVGEEGMIEIKTCEYISTKLKKGDENHIPWAHYDQMQGGMAILERKWCDYIVYCPLEGEIYLERVYFNPEYWNKELYPKILKFVEVVKGNDSKEPLLLEGNDPKEPLPVGSEQI